MYICTVTDFSATALPIGVKFYTAVWSHLGQVFSHFGGIVPGMAEPLASTGGAEWRDMLLAEALISVCDKMSLFKRSAPYWSNSPFVIFDIRALWRSGLSTRVPECRKLKILVKGTAGLSTVACLGCDCKHKNKEPFNDICDDECRQTSRHICISC